MCSIGVGVAKGVAFEITNIRKTQGDLYYQIFNCDDVNVETWNELTLISSGTVTPNNDEIVVRVEDSVTEKNCIRIFQDTDKNGALEFSESGIPKEPVGFSDNPRLMLGYPKPQATAVTLTENDESLLSIKMNYRRRR